MLRWNSRFSLKNQTAKRGAERVLLTVFLFLISSMIVIAGCGNTLLAIGALGGCVYDNTTIEEDLSDIDLSGYVADPEGAHGIIAESGFMEYGYSEDAASAVDFGIYLYLYNPGGRVISLRPDASSVNMAVEYNVDGEPIAYNNVGLTILDHTPDHLLYKCRITDGAAVYERAHAYAQAHAGVRRYDIAGIQIWYMGEDGVTELENAEDERVARTYYCSGYAAGYGAGEVAESTLEICEARQTVIELDVRQTYWRSEYINQNGVDHRNQVTSVYFSIPEAVAERYGDLYAVTASWDERRTSPVIVTNDEAIYQDVLPRIGTTGTGGVYSIYDRYIPSGGGPVAAEWAYNPYDGAGLGDYFAAEVQDTTPVGWVFHKDEKNILNAKIATSEMLQWASTYGYADYLFTDDVGAGRTYGQQTHTYYADEPFDLLTFNEEASGWDKFAAGWKEFWSFGAQSYDWGDANTTVDPIHRVTEDDFGETAGESADNLFINDLDYESFREFYDSEKSDSAVYLFRFAVTDYYSAKQWVARSNTDIYSDYGSTYMARESVFLNFDVIALTFHNEGDLTILPVVADPVNIISGIDPPLVSGISWLVVIIMAVVILALIALLIVSIAKSWRAPIVMLILVLTTVAIRLLIGYMSGYIPIFTEWIIWSNVACAVAVGLFLIVCIAKIIRRSRKR